MTRNDKLGDVVGGIQKPPANAPHRLAARGI